MNYKELSKPLYHGTFETFSAIDISVSAPQKDFGRGFYTTNDFAQASKFARLKAIRATRNQGYVISFNFIPRDDLNVKVFQSPDEEWFDFVLQNRGFAKYAKRVKTNTYDIVIGPVANDAVGVVLNNFIDGVYGDQNETEAKSTAIRLLLTQKLHNQVFFATESATNCLTFMDVTDVYFD